MTCDRFSRTFPSRHHPTAFSTSAMKNLSGKTRHFLTDIRAPHRFSGLYLLRHQWCLIGLLILTDLLALAGSWQLARYFNQFYSPIPPQLVWWVWLGLPSLFWVFAAGILVFFAYGGLYRPLARQQNYLRTAKLISFVYLLSLVVSYFYDPTLDPPRSLFFTAWVASVITVLGSRLFIALILGQFQNKKATKVFLIASAARFQTLASVLQHRSSHKIVGAALASTANTQTTLHAILDSGAEEVLAEDIPQTELASKLYWHLRRAGIALRLLPSSREILYRRGIPEIFAGLPTLRVEIPFLIGWDYRFKRLFDIIGSLFGIILLSPLFLGVAIAIKLSSPGSVFFRQERIGLHGKVFQMWKFRTMVANAEQLQSTLETHNETEDGVMFKIKNDPRIIPIGHFLRRTSIDELPQLFNVLVGQMSLVGPRPLPARDVERFEPWHHVRHQVLPGITGLWQISGRSNLADFNEAARLDLYYIDNWSLNLDLDILVTTVRIVLLSKDAY